MDPTGRNWDSCNAETNVETEQWPWPTNYSKVSTRIFVEEYWEYTVLEISQGSENKDKL